MDSDKFLCALFGIPCCLMEIYISKTKYSSSTSSKTSSKDRRTFIFIWLFIICSLLFSIRCARLGYGSKIIDNKSFIYYLWILFNISLYLMGILLRKQSIEQLGKWFTTVIRIDENQQIIDFGWYEKMRHPSYAGILLYFLALALFLNNWLSLFIIMIPISLVFFYRIHIEEQELKKHFGIKYEEYRQKVPYIIIPKVF
ncbi:unnamed protein product [Rotaria sordida]|uniref:Isoprenylcysteine carboxylmethyltransferase family protein n=1 Tax=Rotaria sordida TaxID=392033 RepID=A0A814LJG3_9BILA|nr:unnamed protein product [Rotaria sordida]CAF4166546.1 unnamed protein product [Rotaria sordida]